MRYLCFTVLIISAFFATKAQAQTINEDRPFTYGTLVVTDNSAVHSMRLRRNGNLWTIDPELIQIGTFNSARFDFRGFPGNTSLNATFTPTIVNGPGSNFFTLTNFQVPSNMTTNGAGNRNNRNIGSRINTSGNGLPYTDGLYTGTILLEITF